MKKLLLTGFTPFGGENINPSWEAVKRIDSLNGFSIEKVEIPVVWDSAFSELEKAWNKFEPDCILMVGQAGTSDSVRIERIAINLCSPTKDNLGKYHRDICKETKIDENGPDAIFSSFDYEKIYGALKESGIKARYSFSAGTYLCNFLLYSVLLKISQGQKLVRAGFIHVPYADEQNKTDSPSMSLDEITKAVKIAANNIV